MAFLVSFGKLFVPFPAAALLTVMSGPALADDPAGRVATVKGALSAQLGKAKRELSASDPVFVGDQIATAAGARANLQLGATTTLKLGERARLTIDRFIMAAGGTVTLGSGALLLDREPAPGNGPIEIRSAYGLIAVRGTQLFAGPSQGGFGVFVVRGRVSVRAAGREVTLAAGEGTDIARPGAPPTPARIWGKARIDAALAGVN